MANSAIRVVGRLDPAEALRAEYGFLTDTARQRAALLKPGPCCCSSRTCRCRSRSPSRSRPGPPGPARRWPRGRGRSLRRVRAVRLLHTADWHIGKTLARRPRIDEAREAVAAVVSAAVEHEVDAVLTRDARAPAPSPEAEQVVYEALAPLRGASGSRWSCSRGTTITRSAGGRSAPRAGRRARRPRGSECRSGEGSSRSPHEMALASAQIAALPWVTERRPRRRGADGARRAVAPDLRDGGLPARSALRRVRPRQVQRSPRTSTSRRHPAGSERQLTIGDLFAVAPQAIPPHRAVRRVGHVHRPQRVPGVAAPARYAGSLQLDFGEAGQQKGLVLVDLEPGSRPRCGRCRSTPDASCWTSAGRSASSSSTATCGRGLRPRLPDLRAAATRACGPGGDPPERARGEAGVRARRGRRRARGRQGAHAARALPALSPRPLRRRPRCPALDLFDRLLDEATAA